VSNKKEKKPAQQAVAADTLRSLRSLCVRLNRVPLGALESK
jgi:hypothetical protein